MIATERSPRPSSSGAPTFTHGITFGGHPVQAAIALANIEIMKRERIVEHVADNEAASTTRSPRCSTSDRRRPPRRRLLLGDRAREGQGDPQTSAPEESEKLLRGFVSNRFFEKGLICRADDRGDPVVQISPPLIAGQQEFDKIAGILGDVLEEAWDRVTA